MAYKKGETYLPSATFRILFCNNFLKHLLLSVVSIFYFLHETLKIVGKFHNLCTVHQVAQWLRCCATNRKVNGSIPDGVIGIFPIALWPWGRLSL